MSAKTRALRWLCRHGHHAALVWRRASEQPPIITKGPREILAASGFFALANWIGWCPRCGDSVEWSTHRPVTPAARAATEEAET